jgi:hypothetical protein
MEVQPNLTASKKTYQPGAETVSRNSVSSGPGKVPIRDQLSLD